MRNYKLSTNVEQIDEFSRETKDALIKHNFITFNNVLEPQYVSQVVNKLLDEDNYRQIESEIMGFRREYRGLYENLTNPEQMIAGNESENKEAKGFEFIIEEKDVLKRENFGSFEIVVCKQGICFKNYTGFRVFTTPYSVGLDGKAHETSLYAWLKYMVDFKKSIQGKENEKFGDTDVTNQEMLDGLKITTEANLIKPMVVFTDVEEAQREALHYQEWFAKQMQDLQTAMETTPPEEDVKANAEFDQKAIMAEEAKEVFNEHSSETEEG